jgi:hypothetical protein
MPTNKGALALVWSWLTNKPGCSISKSGFPHRRPRIVKTINIFIIQGLKKTSTTTKKTNRHNSKNQPPQQLKKPTATTTK